MCDIVPAALLRARIRSPPLPSPPAKRGRDEKETDCSTSGPGDPIRFDRLPPDSKFTDYFDPAIDEARILALVVHWANED